MEVISLRFRPALVAFFTRRIRNRSEAEDLTQDVLMRVAERGPLDPDRPPDAYIFQIAANLLRDRARRQKVRNAYQSEFAPTHTIWTEELNPERVVQARQSLATVKAALDALPERTRTIFILFRLEHMKQREIADMFGISVRTVEQHVVRASVHLRERLGGDR